MDNLGLKYDFSKLAQEIKKHHPNCKIKECDRYTNGYHYVGNICIEDKRFTMYYDFHASRIQIDCSHRSKNACDSNCMAHVVWVGRYELERATSEIIENININYL